MLAKIEILLIIEADIATTQLTEQLLEECKRLGVVYRKVYLSKLKATDFSAETLPLFVRTADPISEFWMRALKRINAPYLYYIDDNFWLIDGETSLAQYYRHPTTRKSLEFAVKNASSVITNSYNLQKFIEKKNPRTVLLPAFFDFKLIPETGTSDSKEYRIGFAGSPSRSADLDILTDVIPAILKQHDNVVFEFIGCIPENTLKSPRVRFYGHMNSYTEYVKFQSTRLWKIALAPLSDSNSNKYKTNNKFREYSAFHYAGVYSNSDSYADSVRHERNGIVLSDNSTKSWIAAINRYIADESLRSRIAETAYRDVHDRFDIAAVAEQWHRLFTETKQQAPNEKFDVTALSGEPSLASKISHYWLLLEVSLYEGGAWLTLCRIIRRLFRILIPHSD